MNCYLPRDTIYQELCHHQNDIFLLFSCNLIFSRVLQFLWFMNPFIKWCWEGEGEENHSCNIAYCVWNALKPFFLAFLPMALGRSASQFIFKIYVSWCSFALFSCVFETKNKGNSSSFVMQPFLELINHHSSTQDQLSSWNSWIKSMKYWNSFRFFFCTSMKVHVKCQFFLYLIICVPKNHHCDFLEVTRELTLQLFLHRWKFS